MRRMKTGWTSVGSTSIGIAALLAGAAQAEVRISDNPTRNMSCSAHVCSPTANNAVLNAGDLAGMLAASDTKVRTDSGAKDIVVKAALSWTSMSRLTLDAHRTVEIAKPVTVAGDGGLTIATNDGGKHGEFIIDPKASVQFWSLSSSLVIDGNSYTLVGDIATLASDIAANPSGFYALAKPYDASADGTYASSPIATTFTGVFEGLGNSVSNFSLNFSAGPTAVFGFFEQVGTQGTVRDFGLPNSEVIGKGFPVLAGTLAGGSDGSIDRCWVSGTLTQTVSGNAIGGLAGVNGGTIAHSFSIVNAEILQASSATIGGLVGANAAIIRQSYSRGSVLAAYSSNVTGGGLVGSNTGEIDNSYSLSSVSDGKANCCGTELRFGGLVGENQSGGTIASSYAAGRIRQARNVRATLPLGGLVGYDDASAGSIAHSYWDLDMGVSDPSHGAGNVTNDPGITGLTTQQLQSGLPNGFSPAIWVHDPQKNKGFPFLRDTSLK